MKFLRGKVEFVVDKAVDDFFDSRKYLLKDMIKNDIVHGIYGGIEKHFIEKYNEMRMKVIEEFKRAYAPSLIEITDIFQELKLEFYIFTHHFQNYYLFDDQKFDSPIYSTEDQAKANNGVPNVIWENVTEYEGDMIERITDSEIEYYLLLKNAADWTFIEPTFNTAEGSVEWGIHVDDLEFRVLPVGMQDDQVDESVAPIEKMDYLVCIINRNSNCIIYFIRFNIRSK